MEPFIVVELFNVVSLLTIRELVVKSVSRNVLVSVIVNVPGVFVICVPFFIVKSSSLELNVIRLDELKTPNITSPFKLVILSTVRVLVFKLLFKTILPSVIVNVSNVFTNSAPFTIVKSPNVDDVPLELELPYIILPFKIIL